MVGKLLYGGMSDVGYMRDLNEDAVNAIEINDHAIFVAVADGSGSKASSLQPASIAIRESIEFLRRAYDSDGPSLLEYPDYFLKEAMLIANKVIGAFKVANEEIYAGFGTCMSCAILQDDGKFAFAHAGNTRIYLIRQGEGGISIRQLTRDNTKAMELLEDNLITELDYYSHPDNLLLTSGLGIVADPPIQSFYGNVLPGDLFLLTTDGIHYAVKPDAMAQIVIGSGRCDDSAKALIEAAKSLKYNDNMAAMIMAYDPDTTVKKLEVAIKNQQKQKRQDD